jgi:hypothetical protein
LPHLMFEIIVTGTLYSYTPSRPLTSWIFGGAPYVTRFCVEEIREVVNSVTHTRRATREAPTHAAKLPRARRSSLARGEAPSRAAKLPRARRSSLARDPRSSQIRHRTFKRTLDQETYP